MEAYHNSLWRFGELSCFISKNKVFKGLIKKVEADGSILLNTENEEKTFTFQNIKMQYDISCL
jgi:ribosome maturation factor RimP